MDTKYAVLSSLSLRDFRRFTGVDKDVFLSMVAVLQRAELVRRSRGGPKRKLCLEDVLLMSLECSRNGATYFHVGVRFGLSEAQTLRLCQWVTKHLSASLVDFRIHRSTNNGSACPSRLFFQI